MIGVEWGQLELTAVEQQCVTYGWLVGVLDGRSAVYLDATQRPVGRSLFIDRCQTEAARPPARD